MSEPAEEIVEPAASALEVRRWDRPWKGVYLEVLAQTGNASLAARQAGVHRTYPHDVARNDEEFGRAFREAREVATDLLEQIAHRRATVGEPKVVTRRTTKRQRNADGQMETIEETTVEETSNQISNALLITLLKANRPEKYRERIDHVHGGDPDAPVVVEVYRQPPPERIEALLRLYAEERGLELIEGESRRLPPSNGSAAA